MIERVFILGLDALEYNLVTEWRMKNLMQKMYGKYKALVSKRYKKPHTPSAWTTIITGKLPDEHLIDKWYTYGRFIDKIVDIMLVKIRRRIANIVKMHNLYNIILKRRIVNKKDIKVKTWFEIIQPSKALFIPAYNEPDWIHEEYNHALRKSIEDYIKMIWKIHEYRKRKLIEELENNNWKLFMVWFDIADLLGHVCFIKRRDELFKAYQELDEFVKKLKNKYIDEENTLFLIVSDHGMKDSGDGVTGDHSFHGFWSINHEISWFKPEKATDFFNLVVKVFKAQT